MTDYMPCPICKTNSWTAFAKRTFQKEDIDNAKSYNKDVFRFIFEVWYPGTESLTFENVYCNNCGFSGSSPRPTVSDLDNLRRPNKNKSAKSLPKIDKEIAAKRSKHMYDYIGKHYDISKAENVLDYGGMDGNLMVEFLDHKKDCYLIDYCPVSIDGVKKIGNTVYDLEKNDKFDIIICNHIVEHLADPRKTLEILVKHLTEDGILFVEVPMEIWKYPPLLRQPNPLTHVSFFTPNSLSNLFTASGASVIKCNLMEYLHTSSDWNPGIRCIGKRSIPNMEKDSFLKIDIKDFLKPTLKTYFQYYMGNRRKFVSEIVKKLKFSKA